MVRFQSWEFVGLIVVGEGISLAKNCGLGKIVIWGCKKFVGVTHNNKFPLDSNTHLEELVTYSAVDTISELLAVGAMAGMVVGFELGRAGGGTGEETLLTCVFDVNAGEEGRLCLEAAVDQVSAYATASGSEAKRSEAKRGEHISLTSSTWTSSTWTSSTCTHSRYFPSHPPSLAAHLLAQPVLFRSTPSFLSHPPSLAAHLFTLTLAGGAVADNGVAAHASG